MDIDTSKIEESLSRILAQVKEMCDRREYGLTNFQYRHIGEVFGMTNGCKVHILPGFEESIMVVRGPSLVSLQRSHAEPVKENMLWKMTVRRHPSGSSIPCNKSLAISDETMAKLPAIIQKRASDPVQIGASDLMDSYCGFRGAWKKTRESVVAAMMVSRDLEGICPVEPGQEFAQDREPVRDRGLDIPRTLDI